MNTLVNEFVATGMLQFGLFGADQKPFQVHLDLLPSYPQVMQSVVEAALPFVAGFDRLVCRADSLPFGVALGMETHIPLVYSQGTQQAAVHDLIGAYDIGHPALLVVQEFSDSETIDEFMNSARQVGLNITSMFAIFNTGRISPHNMVEVHTLVALPEIIDHLVTTGYLPDGHSQRIREWLNRHPG